MAGPFARAARAIRDGFEDDEDEEVGAARGAEDDAEDDSTIYCRVGCGRAFTGVTRYPTRAYHEQQEQKKAEAAGQSSPPKRGPGRPPKADSAPSARESAPAERDRPRRRKRRAVSPPSAQEIREMFGEAEGLLVDWDLPETGASLHEISSTSARGLAYWSKRNSSVAWGVRLLVESLGGVIAVVGLAGVVRVLRRELALRRRPELLPGEEFQNVA